MAKAIQQGGRNVWTGYLEWGGVDDFFWMRCSNLFNIHTAFTGRHNDIFLGATISNDTEVVLFFNISAIFN